MESQRIIKKREGDMKRLSKKQLLPQKNRRSWNFKEQLLHSFQKEKYCCCGIKFVEKDCNSSENFHVLHLLLLKLIVIGNDV